MPNRICNFSKAFARGLLRKGLRKNASQAKGFSTPVRAILLVKHNTRLAYPHSKLWGITARRNEKAAIFIYPLQAMGS